VQIQRGPATVTGDESRKSRHWHIAGKAAASRTIQKPGYLKTRTHARLRGQGSNSAAFSNPSPSEDGFFFWCAFGSRVECGVRLRRTAAVG